MSEPTPIIPVEFWKTISPEDFQLIVQRGGYLNAKECARLWRIAGWSGKPPTRLELRIFEK